MNVLFVGINQPLKWSLEQRSVLVLTVELGIGFLTISITCVTVKSRVLQGTIISRFIFSL